ncbi:UNVERIFIED_ORG: hypothetical protein ABIB52_004548 [Arthrobacter sp. UYCu721]
MAGVRKKAETRLYAALAGSVTGGRALELEKLLPMPERTAPASVSYPVLPGWKTRCLRTVLLRPPISLNRVCLEDGPGATIAFTGHVAQPETGTTPAPKDPKRRPPHLNRGYLRDTSH